MFELYQTMEGSRGTLAEVWIDRDAKVVRKNYKPDGKTIRGGKPFYQSMDDIARLFNNELYWSDRLRGDRVLRIYEHGELRDGPGFYMLQEYVGPDLLHYYHSRTGLSREIEDPTGQIIELFKFFKEHDLYKLNNAMCNLTCDRGIIKAFDFKYAEHRTPEKRKDEIYTINTWLSKIDRNLNELLLEHV